MAHAKTFLSFEEIKENLMAKAPPIVYKYRSWKSDLHKSLLINRVAWFAHPFDLNDPLDVRPDTVFDYQEFDDPRYLDKMIISGFKLFPTLSQDEVKTLAEKQLAVIKANPKQMLENWRAFAEKRQNYDGHGVFSVSTDGLNERLWEEYGDQNKGYALGLRTVDLCQNMKSAFGFVEYNDEPYQYSFLNNSDDDIRIRRLFLKKTKWAHESEFRLITVGIGTISNRDQTFPVEVAEELLLGADIDKYHHDEIIKTARSIYPGLKIYKVSKNTRGLTKNEIY